MNPKSGLIAVFACLTLGRLCAVEALPSRGAQAPALLQYTQWLGIPPKPASRATRLLTLPASDPMRCPLSIVSTRQLPGTHGTRGLDPKCEKQISKSQSAIQGGGVLRPPLNTTNSS